MKLFDYDNDDWYALPQKERDFIIKVRGRKDLQYNKDGSRAYPDAKANPELKKHEDVRIEKGKGAYDFCNVCKKAGDYTSAQHRDWDICQRDGSVYKPGHNSLLAKTVRKYGEGEPFRQARGRSTSPPRRSRDRSRRDSRSATPPRRSRGGSRRDDRSASPPRRRGSRREARDDSTPRRRRRDETPPRRRSREDDDDSSPETCTFNVQAL